MAHFIRVTLIIAIASVHLVEAAAPSGAKARPRDKVKVSPANERIIVGALKYLASKQKGNGSWG